MKPLPVKASLARQSEPSTSDAVEHTAEPKQLHGRRQRLKQRNEETKRKLDDWFERFDVDRSGRCVASN